METLPSPISSEHIGAAIIFYNQNHIAFAPVLYYLYKEQTYLGSLKIDLYLGLFEEPNCELNSIKSYNIWSSTAVALLFCLELFLKLSAQLYNLLILKQLQILFVFQA